jgi:hypothetical protein
LNDHSFALDGAVGKLQLVTGATPGPLYFSPCDEDTREAIRQCVVYCPWHLIVASVGGSSCGVTASTDIAVGAERIVRVAILYWVRDVGLVLP